MENKPKVNGAPAPHEMSAPPVPPTPPADPPLMPNSVRRELPPDLFERLKAPLPQEAVSPNPERPNLSVIKVIYVVERLNEVFGLNGWRMTNEVVEHGKMVVVKGTLTVPDYGIEIEQYGGNDNEDRGDAYKGACTDALSKCASYLGVGMDVYRGLRNSPTKERNRKDQTRRFSSIRSVIGLDEYNATLEKNGYHDVVEIRSVEKADVVYGELLAVFRKRYAQARQSLGETEYRDALREFRLDLNTKLNPELAIRVFRRVQFRLRSKQRRDSDTRSAS
jgi:Rad52/22 family double-strand break repair protein